MSHLHGRLPRPTGGATPGCRDTGRWATMVARRGNEDRARTLRPVPVPGHGSPRVGPSFVRSEEHEGEQVAQAQGRARAGRAKVDEVRKAQQAKERRSRMILITSVGTVILLIAGVVGFTVWRDVSTRPTLDAVKTFTVTREHTTEPVTYAQTPPVGGDHQPTWLNCGVYTEPVPDELAVHSLEHGAVWVTYRPDLPADQVAGPRRRDPRHVHRASPRVDGLPSPVVASAWGTQPGSPASTTRASRSSSRRTARAADARAGCRVHRR